MTRPLAVMDAADPASLIAALRTALTADGPAVLPRAAALRRSAASPDVPPDVSQNVALVIETSGSTGAPKRVALSRDALLASAAASAGALGSSGQWLLALPAHYIAGAQVLVRSIVAESEPVLLAPGHFDPATFAAAAASMTGDARFVSLVPAQLARLVAEAENNDSFLAVLRRFDGILVGGQSMPPDLRTRAEALAVATTRTYGSSETAGGCVYEGSPIGAVRARAVDGQLELTGPVLAEGYLDDPRRTAATFHTEDGTRWYRTGDLGDVIDGAVRVTGRADSVIISGGEKVSLDAVERYVRLLPGFGAAVVVAAESAEWGQVPVVAVGGGASVTLAEMREHVTAALGPAAAPAHILVLGALPELPSGKPDRVAIASQFVDRQPPIEFMG